jgi:superfamily II DNA or RNA helicase
MKIKKIEEIDYDGDVYNLHIADNHNYFANEICVKNCHTAKAYVAQQIMSNAVNSYMRIGLTGTIPKDALSRANLTAGFGPVTYNIKAHELQSQNILSSIHISIFELVYPTEYIDVFVDWHDETIFLQSNDMFRNFVKALVDTLDGNTLILMKNIEPAEEMADLLNYTYISSKLNLNKRQEKFNEFVYAGKHIAVGTYSLLSTGLDIVHINNIILAPTPGKSFTRNIQSIGRGLRRKDGQKEHLNVIDLTSNLVFDRKHIKARKDYYKEAKYPFETDKLEVSVFKNKRRKS